MKGKLQLIFHYSFYCISCLFIGEHIEWIDSNIMRYALSKVSNMAGDLEYATVELDLEQKQWRGIMINAEDAASFTFHNDNHITS